MELTRHNILSESRRVPFLKLVQFYLKEGDSFEPYLRVGEPSVEYSDILGRFLKEANLRVRKNDVGLGYPLVSLSGERYLAVGMGGLILLRDKIFVPSNSYSLEYELGLDKEHLMEMHQKGFLPMEVISIGWR